MWSYYFYRTLHFFGKILDMSRSSYGASKEGLKIIEKQIWCNPGDFLQGIFLEDSFQKKKKKSASNFQEINYGF